MNKPLAATRLRDALVHREIKAYRALVPAYVPPPGIGVRLRRALGRRKRNVDAAFSSAVQKFLALSHAYLSYAGKSRRAQQPCA